uniref:NADH dehydrogenase subunit 6 n=1 Tax=Augilina triaina TaxID=2886257 RepID=UPI001E785075|nr:NADH dehydrogenase subunit 6 [Augilina triaina]UDL72081.1 NADH dehydrogenase subunit 6 [Augilina triaina]
MAMMIFIIIVPMLKHPVTLGFLLLIQTTLISMNMFKFLESTWYSYILFITIIGGMMVMFMFMASISSNEKFEMMKFKTSISLMIFMLILMMMMNLNFKEILNFENEHMLKMEEKKLIFQEFQETYSTFKFFNFNKNLITIIMMLILLITMISVNNIASSFEGPLKKTYV